MIKIAALFAVIGLIAVVALAGVALASGSGNAGNAQGMMGNHGSLGMMNGQNQGQTYGSQSGNGQCYGQGYTCPMFSNGAANNNAAGPGSSTYLNGCPAYGNQTGTVSPTAQNNGWGCC